MLFQAQGLLATGHCYRGCFCDSHVLNVPVLAEDVMIQWTAIMRNWYKKVKVKVILQCAMKALGVCVCVCRGSTSVLDECGWSTPHPSHFRKQPWHPVYKAVSGPWGFELHTVQPIASHYSDRYPGQLQHLGTSKSFNLFM